MILCLLSLLGYPMCLVVALTATTQVMVGIICPMSYRLVLPLSSATTEQAIWAGIVIDCLPCALRVEEKDHLLRKAILLVGLIGTSVICFSCIPLYGPISQDPVQRAIERIPIGTRRSEAIKLLDDAECHLECWQSSDRGEGLFFHGACDPESGTVVIVGSESISGILRVYQIGTYEDYALYVWYDWCLEEQLPDHSE
jgi:hypothetical protein